jgi:NtrC-family two-component system response regulator AlgB
MASSPLADSGHDKLKALVVDDEKNIRTTLSLCLEQMGCKVTAASSAESALAADTAAL